MLMITAVPEELAHGVCWCLLCVTLVPTLKTYLVQRRTTEVILDEMSCTVCTPGMLPPLLCAAALCHTPKAYVGLLFSAWSGRCQTVCLWHVGGQWFAFTAEYQHGPMHVVLWSWFRYWRHLLNANPLSSLLQSLIPVTVAITLASYLIFLLLASSLHF